MRNKVTVATILAISLYFCLVWGYDGLRMLIAPNHGLEEAWRADYVFVVGRLFDLGPVGLIKLAAFFGAMKLVAAGACGLHAVDRVRSMIGAKANSEILEGGLILVVAICIISVGPAVWSNNAEVVRGYAIQLVLACLATALCISERSFALRQDMLAEPAKPAENVAAARLDAVAAAGPTLHP